MNPPFQSVAIVGLGLIGSSIARAVHERLPDVRVTGFDLDPAVRDRARALALVDRVVDAAEDAARGADLVIFCVPVGAMAAAAEAIAPGLSPDALISDVGSCKAFVAEELRRALPEARIVPAHPVAGTENSGPDAGFSSLFQGRWCILTPEADAERRRRRAALGLLGGARRAGRDHGCGASRRRPRRHQPFAALDRLHHRRHRLGPRTGHRKAR